MKRLFKNNNVNEFTVECGRPDSITFKKLITMKKYGVHRISINPQTMNDDTLGINWKKSFRRECYMKNLKWLGN